MDTSLNLSNDQILPIPKCFSHLVVVNVDGELHGVKLKLEQLSKKSDINTEIVSSNADILHQTSIDTLYDANCLHSSCIESVEISIPPRQIDKSGNHVFFSNNSASTLSCNTLCKETVSSDSKEKVLITESQSSFAKSWKTKGYHSSPKISITSNTIITDHCGESGKEKTIECKSPFLKLNSSLMKLQKEMRDLRFLDVSLFCQLMSLQESIQELKMSMIDRFSETGSEFSLGTASYMGSMSSLIEESDWGEDGLSEVFDHSKDLDFDVSANEDQEIASNLLKQIADLAQRVDDDF